MTNVSTGSIPTTDIDELLRLSRETQALTEAMNSGTTDAGGTEATTDSDALMSEIKNLDEYAAELDRVLELDKQDIPCVRVDLKMELAIMRNRLLNMSTRLKCVAICTNR